jgi:CRP/FNR family nitrogen fixation transcriptional regulator
MRFPSSAAAVATNGWLRSSPLAPVQPLSFYPADTEIYAQGEKIRHLYRVEFGTVRTYRLLADGRRQIAAFHFPGEVFGLEANGTHHFFAETVSACGIRVIDPRADAETSRHLLPIALEGLSRAQQHLLVLGRQSAVERLAAFLIDIAERQGEVDQIDLPMSRTDIGDYLGLTIETVSRAFSRLRAAGLISLKSLRCIEIADLNVLRRMTE